MRQKEEAMQDKSETLRVVAESFGQGRATDSEANRQLARSKAEKKPKESAAWPKVRAERWPTGQAQSSQMTTPLMKSESSSRGKQGRENLQEQEEEARRARVRAAQGHRGAQNTHVLVKSEDSEGPEGVRKGPT